jgi:hypothetical protein
LVDYAIEHEKFSMDKAEYLQKLTGINIVTAIQLKRSVAEDKKNDTASSDL